MFSTPPHTLSPADLGIGRLFSIISEAVVVAEVATGRVVLWNTAAEELFGYSAAEAIGLPLEALVPERLKPRFRAGFARYRQTGRGRLFQAGRPLEVPALRKDGAERTVELTLSPIEDAPVGGRFVLAIIRNVAEPRQVEEAPVHSPCERAGRAEAAAERLRQALALTDAALAHQTVDDVLRVLLGHVRNYLAADAAEVLLQEGEELAVRAAVGLDPAVARGARIPLGTGFAGRVAGERRPVILEDAKRAEGLSPALRRKRVQSLLGVPLLAEGQVLGVLDVGTVRRRRFTQRDAFMLQFFGRRVAQALERVRLWEAERRARAAAEAAQRRAAILAEASRAFTEVLTDSRAVLEGLARRLAEALGDACAVMLLAGDDRRTETVALHARDQAGLELARPLLAPRARRAGESIVGRAVRTAEPLLLPSVSLDDVGARPKREHVELMERLGPCSVMMAPLRAGGRVLGTLGMARFAAAPPFAREDLALLRELADRAGLAVENARLYAALAERERQLQDLVVRLFLAQEDERRRVAFDLHDGVAQIAASAHLYLQAFARRHQPHLPAARADLERAMELAKRTVRETRAAAAELRPTVLDDLGLEAALQAEVEELRKEGWRVEYEAALGPERLAPEAETALFRVAQEALHNARKHAGTDRAFVMLRRARRSVRLEVRDWGRGFRPAAARQGAGPGKRVGLSGMKERVALVGGRCEVRSRPGAGTRVVAEVPLRAPTELAVADPTGSARAAGDGAVAPIPLGTTGSFGFRSVGGSGGASLPPKEKGLSPPSLGQGGEGAGGGENRKCPWPLAATADEKAARGWHTAG